MLFHGQWVWAWWYCPLTIPWNTPDEQLPKDLPQGSASLHQVLQITNGLEEKILSVKELVFLRQTRICKQLHQVASHGQCEVEDSDVVTENQPCTIHNSTSTPLFVLLKLQSAQARVGMGVHVLCKGISSWTPSIDSRTFSLLICEWKAQMGNS
jgi:hypothetical protein